MSEQNSTSGEAQSHPDSIGQKGPIVPVQIWHSIGDQPGDPHSFRVHCPYCEEKHIYDALQHSKVALGGVSEVDCRSDQGTFYLILPDFSPAEGVPAEVIHYARHEFMHIEELERALIPRGIDPRAINEKFSYLPDE